MNYGEIIDNNINVYNMFKIYFNNPNMYKIKNVNNLSIYMTKVYCLLNRFNRYIIAIVDENKEKILSVKKLSELNWISLQTRTLKDEHNIPRHSYITTQHTELNCDIKFTNKKDNSISYICDKLSLNIELLYNNINKEYQKEGTLLSAVETYETIITFI